MKIFKILIISIIMTITTITMAHTVQPKKHCEYCHDEYEDAQYDPYCSKICNVASKFVM